MTDAEHRAALAVTRSLGRAGHEVHAISTNQRPLCAASRYCTSAEVVPNFRVDPVGWRESVEQLIRRWGIQVVIPVTEESMRTILPLSSQWAGCAVPMGTNDAFDRLSDKEHLLALAQELGCAVPPQVVVKCRDDEVSVPSGLFPVAMKSHRSVLNSSGARAPVAYADNEDALQARLAAFPADAYPLLVQHRIFGPGTGVFLLRWSGNTVAAFAHRRLREKPPVGGVSVLSESIPLDRRLLDQAERLLAAVDWQGPAMVEFKQETETGELFLMEVNARFWGSLQLAIDAGVDFPRLLLACANGNLPKALPPYRAGIRLRWWFGDLDHLLTRLRRSHADLSLPSEAPGKARVIWDFIAASFQRGRNELLRLDDPQPAFREAGQWLLSTLR